MLFIANKMKRVSSSLLLLYMGESDWMSIKPIEVPDVFPKKLLGGGGGGGGGGKGSKKKKKFSGWGGGALLV